MKNIIVAVRLKDNDCDWARKALKRRKILQIIVPHSSTKNKYAINPLITNGVGFIENK
jgi:hypothetical protein